MPEEYSKTTLDNKMRHIQQLLNRADHPGTPAAEAATARAMAEKLMVKYRIEESTLIESGDLKVDVISVQRYKVFVSPHDSEFYEVYRALASYAFYHVGCQSVARFDTLNGEFGYVFEVFGYEADIRYGEMLFNNARLLFADRMEPKPDPNLSDEDNVYRMRSAGMERIRIASMMGFGTTTSATAKVTRMYKKACAARGEDPTLTGRGNSVKDFRTVYADEFKFAFWERLIEARNAADAEIQEGGLILHGREERVKEALYAAYPSLRPDPNRKPVKARKAKPFKITNAMLKDAERRSSAAGRAGREAGRKAASEINIKGQTPKRRLN